MPAPRCSIAYKMDALPDAKPTAPKVLRRRFDDQFYAVVYLICTTVSNYRYIRLSWLSRDLNSQLQLAWLIN